MPHWILEPARYPGVFIQKFLWRTPRQGALPSLYCALSKDEEVSNGGHYIDALMKVNYASHLEFVDNLLSERLYEVTERLLDDYDVDKRFGGRYDKNLDLV